MTTSLKTVIIKALFTLLLSSLINAQLNNDNHGSKPIQMSTPFPPHWGPPPLRQTRDYIALPDPYGRGSSTLKKWIETKMAEDALASSSTAESTTTTVEVGISSGEEGVVERRFANPSTNNKDDNNDSSSWPEKSLIGISGQQAKLEITAVDSTLMIEILPEDAMVTEDYREDRVRIFVDGGGIVVRQPVIS